MQETAAGGRSSAQEIAPEGLPPVSNEALVDRRRPSAAGTLAALASAADEATWVAAVLDALECAGAAGAHVFLLRDDRLELAGVRGLPLDAEAALRRGEEPAGPRLEAVPIAGGAGRLGWVESSPFQALDLLLAVAEGALERLLQADAGEELWHAVRALEVQNGGGLVEAIAVQACRIAGAAHVEVRCHSATGDEQRACSAAGLHRGDDAPPCCIEVSDAMPWRLPLRAGGTTIGELRVVQAHASGTSSSAGILQRLRRFASVAGARLEIARLHQDVALRAQAETRSRFREERFEVALANTPIMLAIQDRELRYTWVHQPAVYREKEMLGRTDFELLVPTDALRMQMLKQRVLDTGEAAQVEVTLALRGQPRTFQLAVDPVRDPWGTVTGVATAAIDITARAREAGAREQLLLQREDERSWLLSVIERSPVGILLVETEDGQERTTANRRAAELLGHPVDPVRARKAIAGRLLAPDGLAIPLQELPSSRALRGERITMQEALLRRLDGTQIPIVVSAGPIVDAAGRQAGAVVTFDDITPFKEIERMREQWTSLITHDLRQPITSIAGFAAVLSEHPDLPGHLRGKVVHIVAAARRLGRMTFDLLEASRLESRQLALERMPTDVVALVREVIERLASEMQDHPVHLEGDQVLPLLEIDPERFEQVLGNLLSNAAKYSPPGSAIVVHLAHLGNEVAVGVTNTGAGLPVEELGTIFRRFHRTDLARHSRIRGLGLGLYIARGLVEAHGGRIWAETDPGRSVTFRFALPARPA